MRRAVKGIGPMQAAEAAVEEEQRQQKEAFSPVLGIECGRGGDASAAAVPRWVSPITFPAAAPNATATDDGWGLCRTVPLVLRQAHADVPCSRVTLSSALSSHRPYALPIAQLFVFFSWGSVGPSRSQGLWPKCTHTQRTHTSTIRHSRK